MTDRLTVATVLKPQGIRGEIKVNPMTDSEEDLKGFSYVWIGDTKYKVLACRAAGGFAYLSLRGIADRNAAELLRGQDVTVERSEAPELPEGTYYIADIIGCKVVTKSGKQLGEVLDITPARTDVYTISYNGKEVLFPAADGVIADINVEEGVVTVNEDRFKQVATL
ncbi:MAG: ribosome maturation factor RimM [Clostridia bacterium]|nr:ribosome maturation factor RimM [Clostridia bacterium]